MLKDGEGSLVNFAHGDLLDGFRSQIILTTVERPSGRCVREA
jgi:hypothetical protein